MDRLTQSLLSQPKAVGGAIVANIVGVIVQVDSGRAAATCRRTIEPNRLHRWPPQADQIEDRIHALRRAEVFDLLSYPANAKVHHCNSVAAQSGDERRFRVESKAK
jgi:hypothetical protein